MRRSHVTRMHSEFVITFSFLFLHFLPFLTERRLGQTAGKIVNDGRITPQFLPSELIDRQKGEKEKNQQFFYVLPAEFMRPFFLNELAWNEK